MNILRYADAPCIFTLQRFAILYKQAGAQLDTYTYVEKAHGFMTTRTLTASTLLAVKRIT